jgi:hypothetical protein
VEKLAALVKPRPKTSHHTSVVEIKAGRVKVYRQSRDP